MRQLDEAAIHWRGRVLVVSRALGLGLHESSLYDRAARCDAHMAVS